MEGIHDRLDTARTWALAREMGFPAVVGTVDATSRINTGDRVRIDGAKGEVTVLR